MVSGITRIAAIFSGIYAKIVKKILLLKIARHRPKLLPQQLIFISKAYRQRKTAQHLKQLYNFSIDDFSICRLGQPYVDGLFPKMGGKYHVDEMLLHVRKENDEEMMNDNQENHTHRFFDKHYSWLWNLMDSTTRFWICSRLSQRRDIQAGVALLKEMKKRRAFTKSLCS